MTSPSRTPLEWENDFSTDGRFAIQTEHVRGEGACYELWCYDDATRAAARRLDLDLAAYDKRTIKRRAQRIADEVARAEAP